MSEERLPTAQARYARVSRTIDGVEYSIETGKVAKQAHGAALVRAGGTVVLSTAVVAGNQREGIDFFPLMVDYREQYYAAGKIPGGFFRRESKPDDRCTLTARLIDRPIRPLFPKGVRNEVIVTNQVFSFDGEHLPDILAMLGASAALALSEIPWAGPIAGVRLGKIDGTWVVNPRNSQLDKSDRNFIVAASREAVMMVEAGAKEIPEAETLETIVEAQRRAQEFIAMIDEIVGKSGKPKVVLPTPPKEESLERTIRAHTLERLRAASSGPDKHARQAAVEDVMDETVGEMTKNPAYAEKRTEILKILHDLEYEVVRAEVIEKGIRVDGRGPKDLRKIDCEVGILPRTHGSALFTRGQTQALGTCTLGSTSSRQRTDDIFGEKEVRYFLHYNFPGYSVGEAKAPRGPGRREVGHGALAQRAIEPLLPSEEEFPYTIRVVSEILESNGSSSMASVCAGTLALLDAGVPLKAPAAGIAMGLITDDKGGHKVITDIQGIEDHYGDMDFKVAGTRTGVTALQMDVKIKGLPVEWLREILDQARAARIEILDAMARALPAHRPELSQYAPRLFQIRIPVDKIREVIGSGGKTIRQIEADCNCELDVRDDGTIIVAAFDGVGGEKARAMIQGITAEPEIGAVYEGKVVRMMKFGAFVEFLPGKDGLVHLSQLSIEPVRRPEDAVKEGDVVKVKVVEVDPMGRVNLSRKAVLLAEQGVSAEEIEAQYRDAMRDRERGPRDRDRGSRDRDRGPRDRDRGPRDRDRGGFRGDRGPRRPRDDDRGPRREDRPRDGGGYGFRVRGEGGRAD